VGIAAIPAASLLIETAERIADELAATAIVGADRCTWLASVVELTNGERRVSHRTGNPTVYDGDAGIAWALAHTAAAIHHSDLAEIARAGAVNAVRRARQTAAPGLYDGASGIAIAALQTAQTINDEHLANQALELLRAAISTPSTGDDVVSGTAGQLLAALACHDATGDDVWLDRAAALGRSLVTRARRRPWGWSWPSGEPGEPGLCGLAHGASGIAWALAELAARTGTNEFDEPIYEALRYERSWFDRRHGAWPDLRAGVEKQAGHRPFPAWWCHGAAGTGIVRLRLWQLGHHHHVLLAEAGAAFRTTFSHAAAALRNGRTDDFGLTVCHGTAGAVQLFLTAHTVLGENEHLVTARWLCERTIAALGPHLQTWPDGNAAAAAPGLMTGIAGTLITLLQTLDQHTPVNIALFPLQAHPTLATQP
jgi:class II lanthipeptide synthase